MTAQPSMNAVYHAARALFRMRPTRAAELPQLIADQEIDPLGFLPRWPSNNRSNPSTLEKFDWPAICDIGEVYSARIALLYLRWNDWDAIDLDVFEPLQSNSLTDQERLFVEKRFDWIAQIDSAFPPENQLTHAEIWADSLEWVRGAFPDILRLAENLDEHGQLSPETTKRICDDFDSYLQ